jgi:hypothetical protein
MLSMPPRGNNKNTLDFQAQKPVVKQLLTNAQVLLFYNYFTVRILEYAQAIHLIVC